MTTAMFLFLLLAERLHEAARLRADELASVLRLLMGAQPPETEPASLADLTSEITSAAAAR